MEDEPIDRAIAILDQALTESLDKIARPAASHA